MANTKDDLTATLRFQESLLRLTQGLQTGAGIVSSEQNAVTELVHIVRKSSKRV